jgi:hypothetical protein
VSEWVPGGLWAGLGGVLEGQAAAHGAESRLGRSAGGQRPEERSSGERVPPAAAGRRPLAWAGWAIGPGGRLASAREN